jgi:thiamine kinase-like enzyme
VVHRHRVTCVHGDYHIANWLFPTNNDQQRKPVLIDFATTGFDNPMIDLVFFLVVSTNDKVVSNSPLF